jgi:hypothetical protein
MGEALMMTIKRARAGTGGKKKKKQVIVVAAVKQFIREYKAMRMLAKECGWMETMLVEILAQRVKARKIGTIESKLDCLDNEEARQIGSELIRIVAKSINESVGVHDWIEKYPSMKELCERHKFIAPMMEVVVTQIVRVVDWKMLLRATIKVFFSLFDLMTDLYMIFFYFSNDQATFGKLTIVMILMSLLMQCVMVSFIYKGDKKVMRRELLFVLSFVKGGRVQLQLLKGEDTHGCSVDAAVEMVYYELQEVSNDKDRH